MYENNQQGIRCDNYVCCVSVVCVIYVHFYFVINNPCLLKLFIFLTIDNFYDNITTSIEKDSINTTDELD